MTRKAADAFKVWYCAACEQPVNPKSKMINKNIDFLELKNPTRNESVMVEVINEIIELLKANGSMI
jgi:hypothetical protein